MKDNPFKDIHIGRKLKRKIMLIKFKRQIQHISGLTDPIRLASVIDAKLRENPAIVNELGRLGMGYTEIHQYLVNYASKSSS